MFRLAIETTVDTPIQKCSYTRQAPQSLSIENEKNKQFYSDIPKQDGAISMQDSYLG